MGKGRSALATLMTGKVRKDNHRTFLINMITKWSSEAMPSPVLKWSSTVISIRPVAVVISCQLGWVKGPSRKVARFRKSVKVVMVKVYYWWLWSSAGHRIRKSRTLKARALLLWIGFPYKEDIKVRVESAWSSVDLYDVLIVIFDVHRHLNRLDVVNPKQKRVLCMNKVDLVEKKKDLLKVAEQFKGLPGYERFFLLVFGTIERAKAAVCIGAVKRPWDEDPLTTSEEVMKTISLETVREKLLDHIHQEIPYDIEQYRLVDWKELRDGSLRVEQHLITQKMSQRKILVGKSGSKIGYIPNPIRTNSS
ncbi:hypothetical protein C3L33_14466, partial [Rhododendron williamsianum]